MSVSRFSRQSVQAGFPKQQNVWDGTSSTASMDALGAVVLSTTASSISFTSIPQTYTNLHIRYMAFGSSYSTLSTQAGSGPRNHYLLGPGSGGGSSGSNTTTYVPDDATGSTTIPYVAFIDILSYTNTNKTKVVKSFEGFDANGSGEVLFVSGLFNSTAAITSLTFSATAGSSVFAANTTIYLYGIK